MRTDTVIDPDIGIHAALAETARLIDTAAPISTDWAGAALEAYYGLEPVMSPANAQGSDNCFEVTLPDGSRCVFQVSHPDEDPSAIDFQTQALLHIARVDPGLPVPRVVASTDGSPSLMLADNDGRGRMVRLFQVQEGLPMASAPRSAAQDTHAAQMLARLDLALANLWHVAGEKEMARDIQRADRLRPLLDFLPDSRQQALAHQALDGFEKCARPLLPALRRQPIHNAWTPDRLLVNRSHPDQIVAIRDFGRLVEAPLAADLAVAVSERIAGPEDALAGIAIFAAAYHAVSPLQDIEMAVLTDLVRARLAMEMALGAWLAARHGDRAATLLGDVAICSARLQALAACSPGQAHETIAQACAAALSAAAVSA